MFNFNPKPAEPEFTFRLVDHTDICFIHEVRNSAREFLHDNRQFSLQDVIEFVVIKKPQWYIIEWNTETQYANPHGKRVGYFRTAHKSKEDKFLEIGADVHEGFRGRGIAKRAYKQFIDQFFKDGGMALHLKVLAANTRALNLYLNLGFKIREPVEFITRPAGFVRDRKVEASFDMVLWKKDWDERTT